MTTKTKKKPTPKQPKTEQPKHRRRIRMSVCHPIAVDVIVSTREDPTEYADWQIESVLHGQCDVSVRSLNDNATDDDFASMALHAAQAEDLP